MEANADNPKVLAVIAHDFATSTQDLSKVQSLILAHEHFVKSEVLLEAFIIEYGLTLSPVLTLRFKLLPANDQINQLRILSFLKKWIDLERGKFGQSGSVGKKLNAFLGTSIVSDPLKRTILAALAGKSAKTGLGDDAESDDEDFVIPPIITKKKKKHAPTPLLNYDPLEIARQLTLIVVLLSYSDSVDHRNIADVQLKEFINTRWLKPKDSPCLHKNSVRANAVAHWIGYEMICCRAKYRPKLLTQILRIMSGLLSLQNFQSLMSIYLGLNLQPVYRIIQPLFEQLPTKSKLIWDNVLFILSYNNNYSNYRDTVKKKQLPLIPCQEIYLKDLLYHDETFPNFSNGLVDFQKLDTMGSIINYFRKCQITKYRLEEEKDLSEFLMNIKQNITLEILEKLASGAPVSVALTVDSGSDDLSTSTDSQFEAQTSNGMRIPRTNSTVNSPENKSSRRALRKSQTGDPEKDGRISIQSSATSLNDKEKKDVK